jgi:hypothetical protein
MFQHHPAYIFPEKPFQKGMFREAPSHIKSQGALVQGIDR